MKNTFGSSITVTLFGESHGEEIGAVIDGIAPGIEIDREYIEKCLAARRPQGKISTARVEGDSFRIVSGEFGGFTTGTPLTILIKNENKHSTDYEKIKNLPRPSHADYTAECKYHGFQDYRGGGHFSGRITAPLVAAGAILRAALKKKGITVGSHILNLHGVTDRAIATAEDVATLEEKLFPTLDGTAEEKMKAEILSAREAGDSVGGILEGAIFGIPAGVGEPFFDSVESVISHMVFSIPAIKGVEFGLGFGFCDMLGSEVNDEFISEGGRIQTKTNNNGGINGGITNGMPITFRCAVKPTPSIYKEQMTVNLTTGENAPLKIEGRHDPAIIHRVRAVLDAAVAIAVADLLTVRYGTDFLR